MGRRREWTTEDDEHIRALTAAGLSRHAIAVRLGCSDVSVDRRARAIQVPLVIRDTGGRSRKQRPSGETAQLAD